MSTPSHTEATVETKELDTRAINIRIASEVMGWTRWDIESGEDCPCAEGVTYFADWGEMGGLAIYTPPHLTGDVEFNFNPAEEIADAWRVVEKVKGEWHYEIQIVHSGCPSELWDCLIFSDGINGFTGLVSREAGETAALSICLSAIAALKATRAKDEG
jgi:hypothetical protein